MHLSFFHEDRFSLEWDCKTLKNSANLKQSPTSYQNIPNNTELIIIDVVTLQSSVAFVLATSAVNKLVFPFCGGKCVSYLNLNSLYVSQIGINLEYCLRI